MGCGRHDTIEDGKQVHCIVFKHGFDKDMILMTSLLNVYCKCIDIKEDAVFMMKCLKEML